jgi:hypothetical protein
MLTPVSYVMTSEGEKQLHNPSLYFYMQFPVTGSLKYGT